MGRASSNSFRQQLEEIQWDFANLENFGIHLLHWYPATFVAAIPGSLVPILTRRGETVLDPFCGSGVCGVETVRLGRRFLGFDINPVSILITHAKLSMVSQSELVGLKRSVQSISQDLFAKRQRRRIQHPNQQELTRWYHPRTLQELLEIQVVIERLHEPRAKVVGRCLFSSILKSVCSQGKHWGWVCDNVAPKPDEMQPKDAISTFLAALETYEQGVANLAKDMAVRGLRCKQIKRGKEWDARCGDAITLMKALTNGEVSSIVTSPPYYGVADYVKSQRLTFLWFHGKVPTLDGCENRHFEELRGLEVGSRSFRHRAESHVSYLSYFEDFFIEAERVLKAHGTLCLIVGESSSRPETVQAIREMAVNRNLLEIFSSLRGIKATRRRIRASLPSENVLVFQKH